MDDQKKNCGDTGSQQSQQGIKQDKPSHMNQGNQTFYPNQQKKEQSSDRRKNPGSSQPHEEPARKAS